MDVRSRFRGMKDGARAGYRVVAEKREAVGERSEVEEKGRCAYERKKDGE
jgi:hypothetical protein